MNCQEFWNSLTLSPHDADGREAHLAECAECAGRWEQDRALAAGLRSLAEEWRREEAPERVETGLMAAFRMHSGFRVRQTRRPSWWGPVLVWAGAAAATVALAVALVQPTGPHTAKPNNMADPERNELPSPEFALQSPTQPGEAEDDSAVLGAGFVHLRNAPRIQPNEELNVVRFEIPASTMMALGLEVSEAQASETMLADVALGPDGMARAVRLVSEGGSFEE